ncbi:MAG: DUF3656 domain-containing protein [Planctomycetaceae bacterium]
MSSYVPDLIPNSDRMPTPRPELLAPAGDRDCARAAVENGADAIYFGLDCGFNARARATNFHLDNLPELMDFLHRRGVRGYVTLNTLAFSDELPAIEATGRRLADAAVDAVLVQDIGVARLLKDVCPDLALHASTQMTLTSAECIAVAEELGIERVVLARELSIDEIRRIRSQTSMPLEVFVHGALCVAYSGQCLTSESLGGRSANRGQCAQACRLAYDLICDDQHMELGDQKYLLSPQDLAAFALVDDLLKAGVSSLKIEGRLKTPEYVANTVQHYRRAIDAAVEGRSANFTRTDVRELEQSFSRGFSPGWLNGCDHKMLVPATSSAKRGVLLGHVVGVLPDQIAVQLQGEVAPGDGVVFEGDREHGNEQGGRVYHVFNDRGLQIESADRGIVQLAFRHHAMDFAKLTAGLKVWKTDDPRLNQRLRKSFEGPDVNRRVDVSLSVIARTGECLTIVAETATGIRCEIASEQPLEAARKHPISREILEQQFSRLGGTIFRLAKLDAVIENAPMIPLSVLGQLRRQMIELLDVAPPRPTSSPRRIPQAVTTTRTQAFSANMKGEQNSGDPRLVVLCRTRQQLDCVLQNGISHVFADFADIREYREAVRAAHQAGAEILLATPRIQKPGEMGIFRTMLGHQPDGMLVRNLSGLTFFVEHRIPVVADFSLNATNERTVEWLIRKGAERVTASYDMNRDQLLELLNRVPCQWLEIVIHQHMPLFHMEHCVFCSVLSPGTNRHNCGRPCDVHRVELRDRIGMKHPLTADVGCRNTLFNAVPQSSAEVVATLLERGVRTFRIELLNDDDARIHRIISLYRDLLNGTIRGSEVWKQLRAGNRVGVTRGTLEERRNPLAIL